MSDPMSDRPIRRALLSTWDKTGLLELASALAERGVELISTGGTGKALREAALAVTEVSSLTGTPEILDGRVKTLHPAIHAAILARLDLPEHLATLEAQAIAPIDLVVVNLYPFEATAAEGMGDEATIEMIDIGGPALLRAAAKNHGRVTVVTEPADYDLLLEDLREHDGRTTQALRRRLAAKAFARTAAYDATIAAWFAERQNEALVERLIVTATRRQLLRYGENPHQSAALYVTSEVRPGVASAEQVQGKDLSFNNIADADAAFALVAELEAPAIAIVKHANPCGVAIGDDLVTAYGKALACDPVSAYGGIVAANRAVDAAAAEAIAAIFTEVVIAPDAEPVAREILAGRPNLRLLLTGVPPSPGGAALDLRSIAGGLLVQERDTARPDEAELKVVTRRAPMEGELRDLLFAFTVCKHVRSNAVVFAKGGATIGIGAGQMSRIDAVRLAVQKAEDATAAAGETVARTHGSVIASDAFFPFPDGLEAALRAGATAAIQPGGSLRDQEVIAAADATGAAMLFTGIRHFRH